MLIQRIEIENLLSFKSVNLELGALNVFVGANASGKSNLIRALSIIKSLPSRDQLARTIADGGGTRFWINRRSPGVASIRVHGAADFPFHYDLFFEEMGQYWRIVREDLAKVFHRDSEQVMLDSLNAPIQPNVSVFSDIRHPNEPLLEKVSSAFDKIQLYREFATGPGSHIRAGTSASILADRLSENGSNLALRLNQLDFKGSLNGITDHMRRLFELFSDVKMLVLGGIAQVYVKEKGLDEFFAATSLSDGTLRLLCLLTVLLDPNPPPLVCLEEPEIGLHPDAIRDLGVLLIDASSRMQLIITTHSPILVDALSSQPDSIVVTERDFDGFTQFHRLEKSKLDAWLERYSLGELWQKGEIGGNRW